MKLTNDEITMVEAIYICIRDQKLTPDIELGRLRRGGQGPPSISKII